MNVIVIVSPTIPRLVTSSTPVLILVARVDGLHGGCGVFVIESTIPW
jgi:hypothetical protein